MPRFKVKIGSHRENGRIYVAGEIVESIHSLTSMFPEKFEEIPGDLEVSSFTPPPSTGQPKETTAFSVETAPARQLEEDAAWDEERQVTLKKVAPRRRKSVK